MALDTGASTGGFTHVLLTRGASLRRCRGRGLRQAWAHPSLRNDPRVVVLDRVNIRHLPAETIPDPIDLATLDLSFISRPWCSRKSWNCRPGEIVALVKPQFEVGKGQVGQGRGSTRPPVAAGGGPRGGRRRGRCPGLAGEPGVPLTLKGSKGESRIFLYVIRPGAAADALDKPPN